MRAILLASLLFNVAFATVTTVYPDADPETGTVDGFCQRTSQSTWSAARDTASATHCSDVSTVLSTRAAFFGAGNWAVQRSVTTFDTSGIDDEDVISSAVWSCTGGGATGTTTADSATWELQYGSIASGTSLGTGDFDGFSGSVVGEMDISSFVETDGTYNDITITDFSGIDKTGTTVIFARVGLDVDNTSPTGDNYVGCQSAENESGTTEDPKLTITHSVGAVTTNSIFFAAE